jgi:nitrate reductase delta subunit
MVAMRTFKALGWLLTYPDASLIEAAPEAIEALREERLLSRQRIDELARLVEDWRHSDLIDLQEEYTATFDRGRATSLHLFEHVHGESRDRGQAMVDLIGLYRAQGLEMPGDELPDYLPLFLEYLSFLPVEEAKSSLHDTGAILLNMQGALDRRKSRYQVVLLAILDIARIQAKAEQAPAQEEDIDAQYAEEPVTFGPSAATGCAKAEDMVRRIYRNQEGGVRR